MGQLVVRKPRSQTPKTTNPPITPNPSPPLASLNSPPPYPPPRTPRRAGTHPEKIRRLHRAIPGCARVTRLTARAPSHGATQPQKGRVLIITSPYPRQPASTPAISSKHPAKKWRLRSTLHRKHKTTQPAGGRQTTPASQPAAAAPGPGPLPTAQ